jgi:ankyrin repeat protein
MNFFSHTKFLKYITIGKLPSVKNILDDGVRQGFDINKEIEHNRNDALRIASQYGNIAIVDFLLNYGQPNQERYNAALRSSIMFNQFDLVKYLIEQLEQVIDIKKECVFAFKLSGEYGFIECMDYFISKGMEQKILENSTNPDTRKWILNRNLEENLIDKQVFIRKVKV